MMTDYTGNAGSPLEYKDHTMPPELESSQVGELPAGEGDRLVKEKIQELPSSPQRYELAAQTPPLPSAATPTPQSASSELI
jgi:hypothetical protein